MTGVRILKLIRAASPLQLLHNMAHACQTQHETNTQHKEEGFPAPDNRLGNRAMAGKVPNAMTTKVGSE